MGATRGQSRSASADSVGVYFSYLNYEGKSKARINVDTRSKLMALVNLVNFLDRILWITEMSRAHCATEMGYRGNWRLEEHGATEILHIVLFSQDQSHSVERKKKYMKRENQIRKETLQVDGFMDGYQVHDGRNKVCFRKYCL